MKKIILPRLGETMEQGIIVKWLINEGEHFKRGQILVEIESDKTTIELPALQEGKLKEILKKNGEVADIGETIATFN